MYFYLLMNKDFIYLFYLFIQGFEIKRHKETIWSNFCQLKKTILPVSERCIFDKTIK